MKGSDVHKLHTQCRAVRPAPICFVFPIVQSRGGAEKTEREKYGDSVVDTMVEKVTAKAIGGKDPMCH